MSTQCSSLFEKRNPASKRGINTMQKTQMNLSKPHLKSFSVLSKPVYYPILLGLLSISFATRLAICLANAHIRYVAGPLTTPSHRMPAQPRRKYMTHVPFRATSLYRIFHQCLLNCFKYIPQLPIWSLYDFLYPLALANLK